MDAVPLRFVYNQFFLCCVSELPEVGLFWLQSDANFRNISYESDFSPSKVSHSPLVVQRGWILIDILLLQSKLSSVSAEKQSYVINLIVVLKAMELSNTPIPYNTQIGKKWAARTSETVWQKCQYMKEKILYCCTETPVATF